MCKARLAYHTVVLECLQRSPVDFKLFTRELTAITKRAYCNNYLSCDTRAVWIKSGLICGGPSQLLPVCIARPEATLTHTCPRAVLCSVQQHAAC